VKHLLPLALLLLFYIPSNISAQDADSKITEDALTRSLQNNLRSSAPFDLTGYWELLIPKSSDVAGMTVAPDNYLNYFLISRIVLSKGGAALLQDAGQSKPTLTKWEHAAAGTYFQLWMPRTRVVFQFNYFAGQTYKEKEPYEDLWLSIKDALDIGKVEYEGLDLSLRYMDRKITTNDWKKEMDTFTKKRHQPNIITFPAILSTLVDGEQKGDSIFVVFTRHRVLPGK